MSRENRVMLISMIVNLCLSTVKIIVGIFGFSPALIADGIHSFSDLSTDLFAIVGNTLSKKPADDKHPYGHGKLEYITSIGISLIILFVGFSIIYNSFDRTIVVPSILVSIVSIFTIICKYFLARYIIKKGHEYNQNVLIASGTESSTDVISSIVVLVSSILMQFSNNIVILKYADLVATIIVGIFIVKVGFGVLKDNLSIIIGEQETDKEYIKKIKNLMREEEQVVKIDKLVMLKYGSYFKIISEISMDGSITLNEAHDIVNKLERKLYKFDERNKYITIHVNPYNLKKDIS